jgi:small GTP-binding protein
MIQKKICLVGAYGAGKTSLVRRFVESMFDESYHTTVGARIDKKVVTVNATSLMMMIWDLAGGDEMEHTRLSHLRGASGCIIVVDGCRRWTLERGCLLREKINQSFGDLPYVVAVNKSDLRDIWEFESKDMVGWEPEKVFITSAKTGDSVESMFESLAIKML